MVTRLPLTRLTLVLMAALITPVSGCDLCWPEGGAPGECSDPAVDDDDATDDDDVADDDDATDDDDVADDDDATDDDDVADDSCAGAALPWAGPTLGDENNFRYPVICLQPGRDGVDAEFVMGSPETEEGRDPAEVQHRVSLTRTVLVGVREVPQHVFERITSRGPGDCSTGCGADLPMHGVAWMDALAFCNTLSGLDGYSPAYDFSGADPVWDPAADGWRLPTEAEWEWLARGGEGHVFSGSVDPTVVAHCGVGVPVREVATQVPNAWGLVDMSGNVSEWVWDRHGDYVVEPATDPQGPAEGLERVVRGGSVLGAAAQCRVAARDSVRPEDSNGTLGFRIVRTLTP